MTGAPPITAAVAAAPVVQAYRALEARERRAPPALSVRARLERLYARDQVGRDALPALSRARLAPDARHSAEQIAWSAIALHDRLNQAELKRLIPASGWFSQSRYGEKAALAAWLVVQHAVNDPRLMRRTLAALDRMRQAGEAKPTAYAIMYDRVALEFDHKPQRYGTQLVCRGGRLRPDTLENPANLDRRREAVGFRQTEAAYVASMEDGSCAGDAG